MAAAFGVAARLAGAARQTFQQSFVYAISRKHLGWHREGLLVRVMVSLGQSGLTAAGYPHFVDRVQLPGCQQFGAVYQG